MMMMSLTQPFFDLTFDNSLHLTLDLSPTRPVSLVLWLEGGRGGFIPPLTGRKYRVPGPAYRDSFRFFFNALAWNLCDRHFAVAV
jgi:hypothetical protein